MLSIHGGGAINKPPPPFRNKSIRESEALKSEIAKITVKEHTFILYRCLAYNTVLCCPRDQKREELDKYIILNMLNGRTDFLVTFIELLRFLDRFFN